MHAIGGDITLPRFGIDQSDLKLLSEEVSIVLNSAATIRFVEPLDEAVHKNIYSCEQLFKLCDELENLQALIHLSTAYSNCHKRDTIYEIFYEPPMRGAQIIDCIEKLKTCQERLHQYQYVDIPVSAYDRSTCEPQRFFDDSNYPITYRETKTSNSNETTRPTSNGIDVSCNNNNNINNTDISKNNCATKSHANSGVNFVSNNIENSNKNNSTNGKNSASNNNIGESSCKILNEFTQIALKQSNRPNTYTLTKAISESYILDLARQRSKRYLEHGSKVKVSIMRPSIVGAAWQEPCRGLIDNYNGPTGAILALYTGVLQAMPGNEDCVADVVPCDLVVNCAIAIGWFLVEQQQKQEQDKEQCEDKLNECNIDWRDNNVSYSSLSCKSVQQDQGIYLFNMVSGYRNPFRWGLVTRLIAEIGYKYPTKLLERLPGSYFVPSGKLYNIYDKLMHCLPALLIDALNNRVYGRQREAKALLVYNRIKQMTDTLTPFTSNQWRLCDTNVRALYESLDMKDKRLFNFDVTSIDWRKYITNYILGSRVYLLKDDFGASNVMVAQRKLNK